MSSLLDDYVERLVLRALAGIALFAAMAGLLAIPFGVLLTALRNVAPSEGAPAELLGLPPWVLAIGGGALAASAYLEGRRRPVLDATVPATPAKNIPAIVAMVLLPGPAIAVMPPLSDWLTATAKSVGADGGSLSIVLAPIWVAVMLPSGCFIGAAAALSVAGPVGLLLHVGGSRRAGRILLLFWLLQLLFLVSSVPLIRQGVIPGAQGADAIVFVSDVLCAVFLGYSIPVLMLLRNAWASGAIMAEQPPTTRNIPTAGGLSAPPCLVDISLPESSFLVRQAGGWTPFATIAPPPLIVAVPAYSSAVLFHVSPEGSLPVASFLLQSQDGPVCRIRRRTVLLKTTGYTVEDPQSGRVVFDLSKLSADGADWTVDDWTHEPVGSLSLRKSGPSDIDFDLITGGLPTVRYSWRATTWFSAEVAAEWARPAPSGFQPGLVLAVGVALALFLPATLSRGWRRWGY